MENAQAQEKKRTVATLPSDLEQVKVVAKYDVMKHLRSKRLLGMITIEILVLVLITAIPPLSGSAYPTDANVFINRYANFTALLVVICATLFAGDAIVSEFQGRTGYLLFPNPVKRWVLLAGKFIASVGATFLVLIIYYGATLIIGTAITGSFSTLGVESLLLALLYSVATLAVAYLISSVMKGSTGSLIFTFALFVFIFNIVSEILTISNVDPWFMLNFADAAILDITVSPYPVSSAANGLKAGTIPNYALDVRDIDRGHGRIRGHRARSDLLLLQEEGDVGLGAITAQDRSQENLMFLGL